MNLAELAVIFIVALVVLGPERLLKFATVLGRSLRHVRELMDGIKAEFEHQTKHEELKRNIARAEMAEQKLIENSKKEIIDGHE